jgi:hypothetical protein
LAKETQTGFELAEKKQHILEQIKDRYVQFKDTTFISNKDCFEKYIKDKCPNFAHKGPREYPVLVEAVSVGSEKRPVIGYTYVAQVQQYIFDRKLS